MNIFIMNRYISKSYKRSKNTTERGSCSVNYRLATSRPLGERSEPFLAAKLPSASDEVARDRPAPYEIRRRTFLKVYDMKAHDGQECARSQKRKHWFRE